MSRGVDQEPPHGDRGKLARQERASYNQMPYASQPRMGRGGMDKERGAELMPGLPVA